MIEIDKKSIISILYNVETEGQVMKAIEELGELQVELIKYITKDNNIGDENIVDELADVFIMLEQILHIFDIDEKVLNKRINFKLKRTIKKIENGEIKSVNKE